jgi:hypothetical protein
MLRATLTAILVCNFIQAVFGQHPFEALCRHSSSESQTANGVSLSFYPLAKLDKSIDATGGSYRRMVGAEDVLARLLDLQTTQLREGVVDRADFLTADKSSTILFHARAGELIFYPRLLQIHPNVVNFRMRPGDSVGSLSPMALTTDSSVYQAGYPSDRLFALTFPRHTGEMLEPAVEIPVLIRITTLRPTLSISTGGVDWPAFLYEVEKTMGEFYRPLESHFLIAVLSRQRAGFECKLISPLRLNGALRAHGDLWQTLTDKGDEGAWESLLGFQGVRLLAGDRVEVTQLELVAPFNVAGDTVRSGR